MILEADRLGLPARGAGDHRGALDPGPARAAGRAAGPRRPAARPLPRPALGLPGLAQPLAPPARRSRRRWARAPSGGCAARSTSTTCACASGRTSSPSCGRWPSRSGSSRARPARRAPGRATASTRHCSPGCSRTSGCATSDRRDYLGARGARFAIFPGSGLFKSQPDLVMAAELVETSRLWGRQNAAIDPVWAERLGGDLVKRTYSEPHWSKKRESALAHERVTLYGVPLVADRVVPARPAPARRGPRAVRPARARAGGVARPAPVLRDQPPAARGGRASSSTGPAATTSWSTRRRCSTSTTPGSRPTWSPARTSTPGGSRSAAPAPTCSPSTPRCWCTRAPSAATTTTSPTSGTRDRLTLPLRYHFEPGHEADGVTIDVPLATLNTVGAAPFTWNVPGLRQDLVTALIRSLPKQLRVNFVPAPDVARRFLEAVPPGEEPLRRRALALPALAHRGARARGGLGPRQGAGPPAADVPGRSTTQGAEVGVGKDLEALKQPLRPSFDRAMRQVADESGRERDRPDHVDVRHDRAVVHPDAGGPRGARVTRRWSTRAARSGCGSPRRPTSRRPSTGSAYDDCCCWRSRHPSAGLVDGARQHAPSSGWPPRRTRTSARSIEDCVDAAAGELVDQAGPVRDPEAFAALVDAGPRPSCRTPSAAVLHQVLRVLAEWRPVDKALHGRVEMALLPAMTDLRAQLGPAGARRASSPRRVRPRCGEYPRYLKAMTARVERLGEPARDRELMDRVEVLQQAWQHRVDALPRGAPAGRRPAPGALDARGVPRQPLGPAARHRPAGLGRPDPQGARLTTQR